MKKLLSLLLALLMLGSAAAFAEPVPALVVTDPVFEMTDYSGTYTADLSGMKLILAPSPEELPGLCLNVLGDGRLLLAGEALLRSDGLLLSMEGLSRCFFVPYSELYRTAAGVSVPDIRALAELIEREAVVTWEGETLSVRLPYTAVNAILAELLPVVYDLDYDTGVYLEAYLEEVLETDSGMDCVIELREGETELFAGVSLYPASQGLVSEAARLRGEATLTVGEDGVFHAALTLASDPDESGALRDTFALTASVGPDGSGATAFSVETRSAKDQPGVLENDFGLDGTLTPAEANAYLIDVTFREETYLDGEWKYGPVGFLNGSYTNTEAGPVLHLDVSVPTEDGASEPVGAIDASLLSDAAGYALRFSLSDTAGESGEMRETLRIDATLREDGTATRAHFGVSDWDYSLEKLIPSYSLDGTLLNDGQTRLFRIETSELDYITRSLYPTFAMEGSLTERGDQTDFRFSLEEVDYSSKQLLTDVLLEGTLRYLESETGEIDAGLRFTISEYSYYDEALRPEAGFDGSYTGSASEKRLQFTLSEYDYGSRTLEPVFGFDGKLVQKWSGAVFNAAFSVEDYGSDTLEKVLVVDGAVLHETDGGSLNVSFFADVDGDGSLPHIADFDGGFHRGETDWTLDGLLKIDPMLDGSFVEAARMEMYGGADFRFDAEIMGLGTAQISYEHNSGALSLEAKAQGSSLRLKATVLTGEEEIRRCAASEAPVNLLRLSYEESAQYSGELQRALEGLIDYLYPRLNAVQP